MTVSPRTFSQAAPCLLAASLVLLPFALRAQTPPIAQESDWRKANDAVGALLRGHADALKWEQAHPLADPPAAAPTGASALSAEVAVRMAWRAHPDLARALARLGPRNEQAMAEGRWTALDPSLQRRVDDTGELLEVAAQARRAWIEAVAARQVVKHQRDMRDAAQAALELGQRMVTVGNWSALQLAPVQLASTTTRMNLRRAEYAATQAQHQLIRTLGLAGRQDSLPLPEQLPPVPPQAMADGDLAQRAQAIHQQLPLADSQRSRALVAHAVAAYQTAHALALDSQGEALKTRTLIAEETVLHYNGMLMSVWDLLDAVRNQSQATVDAIGAQRDFWLAETDLQWVLQGGAPERFVSLGGGDGGQAPAAAAH